jgi:hypothetical protein
VPSRKLNLRGQITACSFASSPLPARRTAFNFVAIPFGVVIAALKKSTKPIRDLPIKIGRTDAPRRAEGEELGSNLLRSNRRP